MHPDGMMSPPSNGLFTLSFFLSYTFVGLVDDMGCWILVIRNGTPRIGGKSGHCSFDYKVLGEPRKRQMHMSGKLGMKMAVKKRWHGVEFW
ncbi:hypothetical protein AKJ16_DCAP18875 [Drosera capensis]